MEFIDPQSAFKIPSKHSFFEGKTFTRFLKHLLQMKKVNSLYAELSNNSGIEFIDKLIETLGIK